MSRCTLAVFVACVMAAAHSVRADEAADRQEAALDLLQANQELLAADHSLDQGRLANADRLLKAARRLTRLAGQKGANAQDVTALTTQITQARTATQAGDVPFAQESLNQAQKQLLTAQEDAYQLSLRLSLQKAITDCSALTGFQP